MSAHNLSLLDPCTCHHSAASADAKRGLRAMEMLCASCDAEIDRALKAAAKARHAETLLDVDAEGESRVLSLFGDRVPMDVPEDRVLHDYRPSAGPLPDYSRPPRAQLSWVPLMLITGAVWAVIAAVVFAIGFALGMFDAQASQPELLDVEGNVAAYLQANPSIADQMEIPQDESARSRFGFASASGRNVQTLMTALMLLDTAQTVVIAQTPKCLREGNNLASAAFGSDQPSSQRVLLTNALYMVGQWALGAWLDRKAQGSNDWGMARRAYQVLTIVGHGWAIKENHRLGIRPFSAYDCAGRQL